MNEPRTEPAFRRIPKGIWVLGIVSMFMDVSSEMIHSILPLFMVFSLGMSGFAVGAIEGVAEAVALIIKAFSGSLSDYKGRRKGLVLLGYGLSALSKPFFAVTSLAPVILGARLMDRMGKGIRDAPRDALMTDIAPAELRGASFGLRQALDTVGALIGPLLASGLMFLLDGDFRAIFWIAFFPALIAVGLIVFAVKEPEKATRRAQNSEDKERAGLPERKRPFNPMDRKKLRQLGGSYWWVVALGAVFSLARFSEAFLVLRAQQSGVAPGSGAPGHGLDESGLCLLRLSFWSAVRHLRSYSFAGLWHRRAFLRGLSAASGRALERHAGRSCLMGTPPGHDPGDSGKHGGFHRPRAFARNRFWLLQFYQRWGHAAGQPDRGRGMGQVRGVSFLFRGSRPVSLRPGAASGSPCPPENASGSLTARPAVCRQIRFAHGKKSVKTTRGCF